jgi:D-aminopeptidase
MEGVAGLAISPSQMAPTGVDYQYGRRLMTAEANAAGKPRPYVMREGIDST